MAQRQCSSCLHSWRYRSPASWQRPFPAVAPQPRSIRQHTRQSAGDKTLVPPRCPCLIAVGPCEERRSLVVPPLARMAGDILIDLGPWPTERHPHGQGDALAMPIIELHLALRALFRCMAPPRKRPVQYLTWPFWPSLAGRWPDICRPPSAPTAETRPARCGRTKKEEKRCSKLHPTEFS